MGGAAGAGEQKRGSRGVKADTRQQRQAIRDRIPEAGEQGRESRGRRALRESAAGEPTGQLGYRSGGTKAGGRTAGGQGCTHQVSAA